MPGDTYETFCDTIEKVIALDPENVTVHALALKRSSFITQSGEINKAHADAALADRMMAYAEKRLTERGLEPYYLYRQSRMAGNLENTGWAKPGTECAYNIFTMDETETVLACGAGGVTKLKNPYSEDLSRIFNFKYSYDISAVIWRFSNERRASRSNMSNFASGYIKYINHLEQINDAALFEPAGHDR